MIITIPLIIDAVSDYYNLAPKEITDAKIRTSYLVTARHIAIYLSCELTTLTLHHIAEYFPVYFNGSHSPIIHAKRVISGRIESDKILLSEIEQIKRILFKTSEPTDEEDFFGFQENDFFPAETPFVSPFAGLASGTRAYANFNLM